MYLLQRKARSVISLVLAFVIMLSLMLPVRVHAANDAKIHFLTLPANTLAVLVECNGQFGMIDSGEDTDFPSGADARYPKRSGITTNLGFEDDVIAYLKSVGVTKDNFVFYIGTHPHSDHIGSADEVIRSFAPERVYIQEYKDSYITNSGALWDNLYVYDRMIQAAKDVGATIIQKIDSSNANFTLGGGMKVSIKNYGEAYKSGVPDANYFSLGVLLEANGVTAFVSGDINNYDGDESRMIGEVGNVDMMTLGHHGHNGSNTEAYLKALDPELMIVPGTCSAIDNCQSTLLELGRNGAKLFATGWFSSKFGAIVVNFNENLSSNIPKNSENIAVTAKGCMFYRDGIPTSYTGSMSVNGTNYQFNNSIHGEIGAWINENGRWWYRHTDGSYTRSDWEYINGNWFYFDSEGWMVTGWIETKNTWYYLNPESGANEGAMVTGWLQYKGCKYYLTPETGAMVTGWQTIDGKTYHFNSDGAMSVNTWVDGKFLDGNGSVSVNRWITEGGRKWYCHADGTYTQNNWEMIDGKWYFFDAEGWMATGWITWKNQRYYLTPGTGVMVTGWQTIDGKTYHFNSEGAMSANTWVDGKFLDGNGLESVNRWITEGGRKWYCHADGTYTQNNWEMIDGKWYFFDAEGWMATGWIQWKNVWYYLDPATGIMVTGWQNIDGKTYHFNSEGAMSANTWVDGKFLDASGALLESRWITEGGRKWYCHADGTYTQNNWEMIDGKWYFFDAEGWMATGWIQWKNVWYYLDPATGIMVTGWQTIDGETYYFNSEGAMAANTWVDGRYLTASGAAR